MTPKRSRHAVGDVMLVGESREMKGVVAAIDEAAETDQPVLIEGERGAGRELVARAIHYRSRRREGHFMAVNSAAIPPALLEDELTGARSGLRRTEAIFLYNSQFFFLNFKCFG